MDVNKKLYVMMLPPRGIELREQGDVENPDLRIQQIRQQAAHQPAMPAVSVAGPGRGIGQRVRFGIELALSRPHPDSQIDQITSASDANRVIGKFRDRQQPGERKRSCGSPDQAAGTDAACSKASFTTAFDCRGSQHQGRVEARGDVSKPAAAANASTAVRSSMSPTVSDRVNGLAVSCPGSILQNYCSITAASRLKAGCGHDCPPSKQSQFAAGWISAINASTCRITWPLGAMCMPHSFSAPCSHHQRPARSSSQSKAARVHGPPPILGKPLA